MEEQPFQFESDDIQFYIDDRVAVLKAKKNMFDHLADMEKSGQLLSLLDWVEHDPVIHALMFINDHDAFNLEAYDKFIHTFMKEEGDTQGVDNKLIRARQMNTFRSFITKMVSYKKLVIFALQGAVVTPFFGMALAADFRFVSTDMKFVLAHIKYGLHPSGALPFFLPRYLNKNQACELLYSSREINAMEASELNMVHEIFPNEEFDSLALDKAKKVSNLDTDVIRLTKRLSCNYKEELDRYFQVESKLIGF